MGVSGWGCLFFGSVRAWSGVLVERECVTEGRVVGQVGSGLSGRGCIVKGDKGVLCGVSTSWKRLV